ncbi:MAG: hypothetical protein DRJ60_04450 [Thermoprotei archaeon]|nr:MAG: hypothetical protein DRJ60_04450 [Thermoprotei archaeon]
MLAWGIFIAYLVVMIIIGVLSLKKAVPTLSDFFLARRTLGAVLLAFTFCAGYISTGSLIGSVGLNYKMGLSHLVMGAAGILGVVLFAFMIVAPRMKIVSDRLKAITLPDLLAFRFPERGKSLRVLTSLILLVGMFFYIEAIYIGVGRTLEVLLGLPYVWGMAIPAIIVAVYSAMGGYRAVVWTDFVQMMLIVIGIGILAPLVVIALGGWGSLVAQAAEISPKLVSIPGGIPLLMYIYLFIGLFLHIGYLPHVAIKFYTVKEVKVFRWSALLCVVILTIALLPTYYFGVAARVMFGKLPSPDQALPLLSHTLLPPALDAIVMTAVVAAAMSTTNAMLLIVSGAIVRDFYQQLFRPKADERYLTKLSMISTLIMGLLPILPAISPPPLMFIIYSVGVAILKGGFLVPILLTIWWKRATGSGILAGMLGGTIVALGISAWYGFAKLGVIYAGMTAAAISAIICVIASYATKPQSPEFLAKIFS